MLRSICFFVGFLEILSNFFTKFFAFRKLIGFDFRQIERVYFAGVFFLFSGAHVAVVRGMSFRRSYRQIFCISAKQLLFA